MIERRVLIPSKRCLPFVEAPVTAGFIWILCKGRWGTGFTDLGPMPLVLFLVAAWLVAGWIKRMVKAATMPGEARNQMTAFATKPLPHLDTACYLDPATKMLNGTAIGYDGERILIMDNGEVARVPWSDVRSWTWRIPGHSKAVAYGGLLNPHAAEVAVKNAQAEAQARTESGFFLTVADIGKPVWQFQCDDQRVLERWYEIFNQINEGRLKVAAE